MLAAFILGICWTWRPSIKCGGNGYRFQFKSDSGGRNFNMKKHISVKKPINYSYAIRPLVFKPFERERACNLTKEFHVNHIACCNTLQYVYWLNRHINPLLQWNLAHPLPTFYPQKPCVKDVSVDHVDHPYCCNFPESRQYDSFINTIQEPIVKLYEGFTSSMNKQ